MLQELFMSVCLLTTLNCNDVYVDYHVMSYRTEAAAIITESGRYGVLFNTDTRRAHGAEKKYLMIHEVAHLLVYEVDSTNTTHNKQFMEICLELGALADIHRPDKACAPRTECLGVLCRNIRPRNDDG